MTKGKILGQSPTSCPQGQEKSGGFAAAFFLVKYISSRSATFLLLAEIIRIPICVCVFTKCRNQGCAGAKLNRNIQQDKTSDIIIERVVCCCPIFHDRPDIVLCIVSSVFIILISICIALNGQALKSKL